MRTPEQIIGRDTHMQLISEGYEVLSAGTSGAMFVTR